MKLVKYLKSKEYHWTTFGQQKTLAGKVSGLTPMDRWRALVPGILFSLLQDWVADQGAGLSKTGETWVEPVHTLLF
jgi:hypothetical protein